MLFVFVVSRTNIIKCSSTDYLKWRYKTHAAVYSSPAIGTDGTIYVGSDDGYLYAVNASGNLTSFSG